MMGSYLVTVLVLLIAIKEGHGGKLKAKSTGNQDVSNGGVGGVSDNHGMGGILGNGGYKRVGARFDQGFDGTQLGGGINGGNGGETDRGDQINTVTQQAPASVPQPYPVPIDRPVPIPVNHPYPIEVPRPVQVPVPASRSVEIPRPVSVTVDRPLLVPVPQAVAILIPQPVQVPVPQPYPLSVPQPVPVRVPQPVVVPVLQPVYVEGDCGGVDVGSGGRFGEGFVSGIGSSVSGAIGGGSGGGSGDTFSGNNYPDSFSSDNIYRNSITHNFKHDGGVTSYSSASPGSL